MSVNIKKTSLHHNYYQIASTKELALPTSLKVNLKGNYQAKNLATALQAITIIRGKKLLANISNASIVAGLDNLKERTYFIGRWQQLGTNPTILCDSGHNVDGLRMVFEQLKEIKYTCLLYTSPSPRDRG